MSELPDPTPLRLRDVIVTAAFLATLLPSSVAFGQEAPAAEPAPVAAPAVPVEAPAPDIEPSGVGAPEPGLAADPAPAASHPDGDPGASVTSENATPSGPAPAHAGGASSTAPPEAAGGADSGAAAGEAAPPLAPVPAAPEAAPAEASEPPVAVEAPMPSPLADPLGFAGWLLSRPEGSGHDLSPWGMYRGADIVVKLVMLGLAFASLVTWTVWLAKTLELWGARARLRAALRAILGAQRLDDALASHGRRTGPAPTMLRAARDERDRSTAALPHAGGDGLERRVTSALMQIEVAAGRRIARGTGILATIGSTAPFVGLFGTVWGIMNSFVSIAESNTTNLAVVAPGIAEALLATAIGLVAAIPAVVAYNLFARAITGWRQELGAAAAGIERLISRDLDFARPPAAGQAADPAPPALAAE